MMNDHDEKNEEREEIVAEEEEEGTISKRLKEELREAQKQCQDYLAGWQRAKADAINARREEEQSRDVFVKMATQMVLQNFLALADSFEEALRLNSLLGPESPSGLRTAGQASYSLPDEVKHGIMPLYEQLKMLLGQHGIKEIETKSGDRFDPAIHEALEGEGEMVADVLQKGFMLYDKVLRPARVKVKEN